MLTDEENDVLKGNKGVIALFDFIEAMLGRKLYKYEKDFIFGVKTNTLIIGRRTSIPPWQLELLVYMETYEKCKRVISNSMESPRHKSHNIVDDKMITYGCGNDILFSKGYGDKI